jgi:hypothetical protein
MLPADLRSRQCWHRAPYPRSNSSTSAS